MGKYFMLLAAMAIMFPSPVVSAVKGDINNDGTINSAETIFALQMATGAPGSSGSAVQGDIDCDGKVGISEAIYSLGVSAGLYLQPVDDSETIDYATYEDMVAAYTKRYCKSNEWQVWMVENKGRYANTFAISQARPETVTISFRYETTPIDYSPAWPSEAEHMAAVTTMAQGAYPNYNFNLVFNGNTSTSYANIIAGTASTISYSSGKNVYLHFETIFNHEFGHTMGLPHHYNTTADIGVGMHMPPGETTCIMDRTSTTFCSACRAALGILLNTFDTSAMDEAINDILSRYPDPDDPPGCWLYQC